MPDALPLTGLYGKVPAHGDFIRRGLPTSFVGPWDSWLQDGMATARELLGERWAVAWDGAPAWRFALPAGACGPDAVAGVLLPSEDMVGRRFPITLAALLAPGAPPPGPAWFAALEAAALAARAGRVDADALARAIPPPDAVLDDALDLVVIEETAVPGDAAAAQPSGADPLPEAVAMHAGTPAMAPPSATGDAMTRDTSGATPLDAGDAMTPDAGDGAASGSRDAITPGVGEAMTAGADDAVASHPDDAAAPHLIGDAGQAWLAAPPLSMAAPEAGREADLPMAEGADLLALFASPAPEPQQGADGSIPAPRAEPLPSMATPPEPERLVADGTLAFLLGEGATPAADPAPEPEEPLAFLLHGEGAATGGSDDPLAALLAAGGDAQRDAPWPAPEQSPGWPAAAAIPPAPTPAGAPPAPPGGGWWTGGGGGLPASVRPCPALLAAADFVRLLEAEA